MNGGNAGDFDGGCRVRRCHLNGKNAGADKQRKVGEKVAEIKNNSVQSSKFENNCVHLILNIDLILIFAGLESQKLSLIHRNRKN